MLIPREYKGLIKEAESAGYTVGTTKNNHLVLRKPGCTPIYMSATPSDHRAVKNAWATFRRLSVSGSS